VNIYWHSDLLTTNSFAIPEYFREQLIDYSLLQGVVMIIMTFNIYDYYLITMLCLILFARGRSHGNSYYLQTKVEQIFV